MRIYAYKGKGSWKIGPKIRTYQKDGKLHIYLQVSETEGLVELH